MNCVKAAKSESVPNIQINSNMINVELNQIFELVENGCNYIEISVDAKSINLWLKMRGLENNCINREKYLKFIDVVNNVAKIPGLIIDFNFTPSSINFDELYEVYEWACELGIRYFSFQNLVNTTNDITNIALPSKKLSEGLERCKAIAQKYNCPPTILVCCSEAIAFDPLMVDYNVDMPIEEFKCTCGKQYVYLNYLGQVRLCCFGSGLVIGDYNNNFSEIWTSIDETSIKGCPII